MILDGWRYTTIAPALDRDGAPVRPDGPSAIQWNLEGALRATRTSLRPDDPTWNRVCHIVADALFYSGVAFIARPMPHGRAIKVLDYALSVAP
jgi:hypothetical protein